MSRPIASVVGLSWILGVPLEKLERLASNAVRHYHPFKKRRAGKQSRLIDNPDGELKAVQTRIDRVLLKPLATPNHLHGGIKGRSALTNALQHLARRHIVRIDIKSFFPSVTDRHVYLLWTERLGYSPPAGALLTPLTTIRGHLPQGSPTSSSLANLVLLEADSKIQGAALSEQCCYTRYVDDLVFSGDCPQKLIQVAAQALRDAGFAVSRKKILLMPAHTLQEVTGYSVNSRSGPSIARRRRSQVRAAIHHLQKIDNDIEYERTVNSIRGRIQYIGKTNPGSARSLRQQLEEALSYKAASWRSRPESGAPQILAASSRQPPG